MSIIINKLKQRSVEDDTQERLAETYFSSYKRETGAPNISTDKEEIPPRDAWLKKYKVRIAGMSAGILLLLVFFFYIFTIYTFDIAINVNKKARYPYGNLLATQKINPLGEAAGLKRHFFLINSPGGKPAGIAIKLKRPVDFSEKLLSISTISKKGGGKLSVILRDKNYKSFESTTLHIKDVERELQNFIVSTDCPKLSIDMQNIRQIRLELKEGELPNSEIYIKRVALIERGEI